MRNIKFDDEVGDWLSTNRLISRRHAALPTKLLPELIRSRTPEIKRKKSRKHKRNKTNWSVKQGFTSHHNKVKIYPTTHKVFTIYT